MAQGFFAQIYHAGRQTKPDVIDGECTIAPSRIIDPNTRATPRAMSVREIEEMVVNSEKLLTGQNRQDLMEWKSMRVMGIWSMSFYPIILINGWTNTVEIYGIAVDLPWKSYRRSRNAVETDSR